MGRRRMRHKLALTIALGTCAAAVMVGVSLAGADTVSDLTNSTPSVSVPDVTTPTVPLPACANGADDDGDGLADLADPDCVSSAGTSEGSGPAPVPLPPTGGGGGGGGGGGSTGGGGGGGSTGGGGGGGGGGDNGGAHARGP